MSIARYLDHTLLSPQAVEADIQNLCGEAKAFGFKAVCVAGCHLGAARELLAGSGVLLATVVGFPHGNTSTEAKCCEATAALEAGADELDVVLNVGWVKSGLFSRVSAELERLRATAPGTPLKLILETCYLDREEKRHVCQLALEARWDFVKTSTGFGTAGATLADVALMTEVVGAAMEIKASGGIRDYETALQYLRAGATRIGTSSGPAIVAGENQSKP
jgi:deoxyribose-phosphate aldolase